MKDKTKILLFVSIFFLLIFIKNSFALSISQCSVLDQNNSVYTLSGSFTNTTATTCMNITAFNTTLDCQGYNVNGTRTSSTYGVYIKGSNKNDTVQNCSITNWYHGIFLLSSSNNTLTNNIASNNSYYGIYLQTGSPNNTITNNIANYNTMYGIYLYINGDNNTITNNTANSDNTGIYLSSSSNNILTNNTANSNVYGFIIYALTTSSNNIITGGSIASSTTYDYYFSNGGKTNNFTNTNFTGLRKIILVDTTSWLNYANDTSGLWLNTNGLAKTFQRTLNSWSNNNLSWNENITSGTGIANYTVYGLIQNANYTVYNYTTLSPVYTLNASSCGCINFTINLNTTSRTIQVNTTPPDTTPPKVTISSPSNTTYPLGSVWMNVTLDEAGSWCGVSLNNTANQTLTNSTGNWNLNLNIPSKDANNVTFCCNDTSNNMNCSMSQYFTIDNTLPTYSNLWQNVTNNTVVGPTIIGFGAQWNDNIGLSMFVNSSNVSGWANDTWASFTTGNWSNFTMDTTGITAGAIFQFKIYANDTSNNQNVTELWQYTRDGTPPTYSSNSTNSTTVGTPVLHSLNWSDNIGLSGYIFSFDNCTGSLTNDSWVSFSGGTWSNVTKTINSTSCIIRWCIYANDTSNNWNGTSCDNPFTYATSAAVFISISLSPALMSGITFGTINPGTNDNPALNNTNGPGGGTAYNITIDSSTTVNVDLYNDASGDLVSGSYIIGIGNVTNQANTTSNTGNNLVVASSIVLSTTYSIIGSICQNLLANSNCWISYWLDSPTAQPPGSYTTTYKYCAVQNGAGYSQCG